MKIQFWLAIELVLLVAAQAFLPQVPPPSSLGVGYQAPSSFGSASRVPFTNPTTSGPLGKRVSQESKLSWGLPSEDVLSAVNIPLTPHLSAIAEATTSPLWTSVTTAAMAEGSLLSCLVPTMLMATAMGLTLAQARGSSPESTAEMLQDHYESAFVDLTIRPHEVPTYRFKEERLQQFETVAVTSETIPEVSFPSTVALMPIQEAKSSFAPALEAVGPVKPAFVSSFPFPNVQEPPRPESSIPMTVIPLDPAIREAMAQPYFQTVKPALATVLESVNEEILAVEESTQIAPSMAVASTATSRPDVVKKSYATQSIILLAVQFLFNGFGDWTYQLGQLLQARSQTEPEQRQQQTQNQERAPRATESIILKSVQATGRGLRRLGSRLQNRFRTRPA